MFDTPYPFNYLGTRTTLVPDPVRKYNYRFVTAHRRYLVTFELYSFNVVAVKYCDMDDRNAKNRYDKIFNDADAFKVIGTCLHIMFDFWRRNPNATFCFYAVPRKWDDGILDGKELAQKERRRYIERYKNVRFEVYNYAMVNLFPPKISYILGINQMLCMCC